MLDLVIRGGDVVTPQGVGRWDVAIEGERIVARATEELRGGVRVHAVAADATRPAAGAAR